MKSLCRVLGCLILVVPLTASADDKDHPELDKKTAELMKKIGPLYKEAKSLKTDAVIETTVTPEEGDKQIIKCKAAIEFQRPNMFALRSKVEKDDKAGLDVVSDGKALFIHGRRLKQFTEGKAPKGLEGIGRAMLPFGANSTGMLFQNVLAEDPAEALLEGVTKGEHVGMVKLDGKDTHHLKFRQEGLDWELWVAAEGQPWVLKASSTMERPNVKMTTVETYSNWKMNGEPTKDVFTFKAPDDAKKVKALGRQKEEGDDPRQ